MIEVPKGYRIEEAPFFGDMLERVEKRLVRGRVKKVIVESFRLTERNFNQTDHYLGYMPSQVIEFLFFE